MKVSPMKIKFLGKTAVLFRVLSATGEVLQVLDTEDEARDWIANN